jgi:hypothetical protein
MGCYLHLPDKFADFNYGMWASRPWKSWSRVDCPSHGEEGPCTGRGGAHDWTLRSFPGFSVTFF